MRRTCPPSSRRCRVLGRTARLPDRSPRTSCTSLLLLRGWDGHTRTTIETDPTRQYDGRQVTKCSAWCESFVTGRGAPMEGCGHDDCVDRDRCARGVLLRCVADPVSAARREPGADR